MRIPEETIEIVRQSQDIADLVGQYVPLRKKGKQLWGVCPFHSEKTPSFSVNQDKQIFYCFGCHVGGNVFKFLMDFKKISYIEAVIEIAKENSISIQYEQQGNALPQSEKELMFDLNEEVARQFLNNLHSSPAASHARDYFEKRNLKTNTLRGFGLGYAPSDRQYLSNLFSKTPEKLELAIKLGLIIKNDSGALYDRFAGRIIFPIFSPNGRVIAFAGRTLEEGTNAAKYMNSPESAVYTKGKVLYGLSLSKDDIRKNDRAIMVEGYMDLLSLFQNGVKNVIAVSGTALTNDQTVLLSRYTKNITALFDADEAGVKASMRSVEILLKRNMNILVGSLGDNEDPDSFINKHGKDALLNKLSTATNFLEFQTAYYFNKGAFNDPQKSGEVIRELLRPLALLEDPLKQAMLIRSMSERFSLREKLLEDELSEIIRKSDSKPKSARQNAAPSKAVAAKSVTVSAAARFAPLEKELLRILCEGNKYTTSLIKKHISIDELSSSDAKQIVNIIYTAQENGQDTSLGALVDKIENPELVEYLTSIASSNYVVSAKWEEYTPTPDDTERLIRITKDTIKRVKQLLIDQEVTLLKAMIAENSRDEKIGEYLRKIQQAVYRKQEIEKMLF